MLFSSSFGLFEGLEEKEEDKGQAEIEMAWTRDWIKWHSTHPLRAKTKGGITWKEEWMSTQVRNEKEADKKKEQAGRSQGRHNGYREMM